MAVLGAGVVGLVWLAAIWTNLVFPPPITSGGGAILKGDQIAISEHEWGFNQATKGGPEILVTAGHTVTIKVTNNGKNLHSFQVVLDGGQVLGGLNKTDLIPPGETRTVTVTIRQTGSFLYICPVSGHRQKGMVAPYVVQPTSSASQSPLDLAAPDASWLLRRGGSSG